MKFSAFVVTTLAAANALNAQQPDSVFKHSALVITTQRTIAPIHSSVSAITRLDNTLLAKRPVRTLAEALQQAPGVAFVDFEGSGADPQAIVRGFYGGGESEFLLLLVDGQPINKPESGRITWDLLPLTSIQSIELVRGPASAVWGDAAIGGVINLITRGAQRGFAASVSGGGLGWMRAAANANPMIGGKPVSVFGNYSASEGFRDHAERNSFGFGASTLLFGTSERGLSLSTLHDVRELDDPGPLLSSEMAANREQSSPFYRFDESEERLHRLSLAASVPVGSASLRAALTGDHRDTDRIRTLRLAPVFADTKEREFTASRVSASALLDRKLQTGNGLIGVDASYARLDSDYFEYAAGPAAAYTAASGQRGELDSFAEGNRATIAGFIQYSSEILPRLTASVGSRIDYLRDAFTTDAESAEQTESRTVASHRGGLNFRYTSSQRQSGNMYVSVSQTFKAATPDQLYDRRKVPVPFPPFAATFSSTALDPQRGVNYEAGVYHDAMVGTVSADLNIAAYQMDLRDEIDFDVSTLSYGNIGKSRHRGIEAGLNLSKSDVGVFANYALQAVTFRSGDNSGNYLKAIPRHFIVSGVSAGRSGLLATVMVTSASRMYLDDANQARLPDWKRWDLRAAYTRGEFQVTADLRNLADKEYSTTGFPDPSGSGDAYYYPAAGRTLHVGVAWNR